MVGKQRTINCFECDDRLMLRRVRHDQRDVASRSVFEIAVQKWFSMILYGGRELASECLLSQRQNYLFEKAILIPSRGYPNKPHRILQGLA